MARSEAENKSILLIVALELLGLVVAVGLTLPWAVEKTVGLRKSVLVEIVIPGRLTIAAHTASAESRKRKGIFHSRNHVSMDILSGHELRTGAAHPDVPIIVRECSGRRQNFGSNIPGRLAGKNGRDRACALLRGRDRRNTRENIPLEESGRRHARRANRARRAPRLRRAANHTGSEDLGVHMLVHSRRSHLGGVGKTIRHAHHAGIECRVPVE